MKTSHPRIWSFIATLNQIIQDVENDIGRLCQGREISRARKKKDIRNDDLRRLSKQKLSVGECSPWEFLQAISYTIGNIKTQNNPSESDTEYSGEEDNELVSMESVCVVCLLPRTSTWIFMPCRHANYCGDCSHTIEELGQPCPVCRSVIQSRFEIFTN